MTQLTRRSLLAGLTASLAAPLGAQTLMRRIPTQFIASTAWEGARRGTGAESWGLWETDPGPIGVRVEDYEAMRAAGGTGPTGWVFDETDWWLDEYGQLMKPPRFPIPPGGYFVTNGVSSVSLLTIEEPDAEGETAWSLSLGQTIGDVTHGPCRAGRYRPEVDGGTCSPGVLDQNDFPLAPGASPPGVTGCDMREYAVLIVFGVPA